MTTSTAQPSDNNRIQMKLGFHRPTSLVLEGPGHTGKMACAKSLGPHNYICGHLNFNPVTFSNDVLYNVFYDVAPNYLRMKH